MPVRRKPASIEVYDERFIERAWNSHIRAQETRVNVHEDLERGKRSIFGEIHGRKARRIPSTAFNPGAT